MTYNFLSAVSPERTGRVAAARPGRGGRRGAAYSPPASARLAAWSTMRSGMRDAGCGVRRGRRRRRDGLDVDAELSADRVEEHAGGIDFQATVAAGFDADGAEHAAGPIRIDEGVRTPAVADETLMCAPRYGGHRDRMQIRQRSGRGVDGTGDDVRQADEVGCGVVGASLCPPVERRWAGRGVNDGQRVRTDAP
ncbi:hypothetical protein [Streptomyces sp. NPDC059371]|uniref:hypothetical protein n=1 Tax=Streptomyces sp. NPDC059371 TaxID=3346812 RepID=UPI0036848D8E